MALFSFVVPIYKVPYKYLHQCIESLINQSYKNIEILLVDDGSPDECGIICDGYSKKDSRIKVIHKKNGGLSDARNAGLDCVTGEWVSFVDGDDWVDEDFVNSFFELISKEKINADIYIYSGYRDYEKKQIICTPYYDNNRHFSSKNDIEDLQKECCFVPYRNNGDQLFIGSAWAKIYKTIYLKKNNIRFTIVPYGEDSIFFMYVTEKASSINYISQSVYHYRDTDGSMVNKYRNKADEEQVIYLNKLFEFAKNHNKSDEFIKALYLRVFISMQRCISQKFYNKFNNDSRKKRHKACQVFFSSKPFCDVYKNIDFWKLSLKWKYKYICCRLKLYGFLNFSRSKYLNQNGKISQGETK